MRCLLAIIFLVAFQGTLALPRVHDYDSKEKSHQDVFRSTISNKVMKSLSQKLIESLSQEDRKYVLTSESKADSDLNYSDELTILSESKAARNGNRNSKDAWGFNKKLDGLKIQTEFQKQEFSYTTMLALSANDTKSPCTLHQSSRHYGRLGSEITAQQIDPNSNLLAILNNNSGQFDWSMNSKVEMKGFTYDSKASANSTLKSYGEDRQRQETDNRVHGFNSTSKVIIESEAIVENKLIHLQVTVETTSETYTAPFRKYFTNFESKWSVNGPYGSQRSGKILGEMISRVVASENGESMTRHTVTGTVIAENNLSSGISNFKLNSHTWTTANENNETGDTIVDVLHSSVGQVSTSADVGDRNLFSGSGAISFEKSQLVITSGSSNAGGEIKEGLEEHEFGVAFFVNHILNGNIFNFRDVFSNFGVLNII